MATTAGIDSERLEELRGAFSGSVLQPGDDGYDDARRVHNGLIDRRPALIARCQNDRGRRRRGPVCARTGSRDLVSAAAATTSPGGRSSTAR